MLTGSIIPVYIGLGGRKMLISDLLTIGNRLLSYRKRLGLTQSEVAEASGISDRTYADIERGKSNMRVETIIKICQVLHITPDEIFTQESGESVSQSEIFARLDACNSKDKETALRLLDVYLKSLD